MSKLELKQRKRLFAVLEFMAMVAPTPVVIKLFMEFEKQILLFDIEKVIDPLMIALIRGSKYTIATALQVILLSLCLCLCLCFFLMFRMSCVSYVML